MHLRYYTDENGKRVYTLKSSTEDNLPTFNAHPGIWYLYIARFSPDDKFSQERIDLKIRFNLLPTQQTPLVM